MDERTDERTDGRMDGRTDKRTNKRMFCFGVGTGYPAIPRVVLCAVTHKRGRLKIEFGFQQNKNSFL